MSTSSISSNPVETSPFEVDFVLPEDPNVNVPLSTRMDFVGKAIGIGLILVGVAGLKYAYTHLPLRGSFPSSLILFYGNIFLGCSAITVADIGCILLFKQSYHSPNTRKKHREELEQGKITLQDFIYKHGWERILTFGFHLSDDAEPLITKKHFSKSLDLSLQDLDKGFNDTFDPTDLIYSLKTTLLWQFLDYNLFSREQKKDLKKEFINRLDTIPAYTLVKNWTIIQELGWKECFSEAQQKELDRLYDHHKSQEPILFRGPKLVIMNSEEFPFQPSSPLVVTRIIFIAHSAVKTIHQAWDPEYTMLSKNSKLLTRYSLINKQTLEEERLECEKHPFFDSLQKYYDSFKEPLIR